MISLRREDCIVPSVTGFVEVGTDSGTDVTGFGVSGAGSGCVGTTFAEVGTVLGQIGTDFGEAGIDFCEGCIMHFFGEVETGTFLSQVIFILPFSTLVLIAP